MDSKNVKLRLSDETARTQLERLIEDSPGWSLGNGNKGPCDLLVFEITKNRSEEDLRLIREMLAAHDVRHLFLVSSLIDQGLFRQALRLGAKEFFPLPLNMEEVKLALLKFSNGNGGNGTHVTEAHEKEGTIIHLIGSKGGVGTTTIAVNLASSLVKSAKAPSVALADMNLLFGDIPVFLGIQSYNFDWTEITHNITRLDRSFLAGTLHKHPSGIQVLLSPARILKTIASGPEVMTKLFKVMKTMFDYVIVDGGESIGGMSKGILTLADKVLIITQLNLPCLINVKRMREAFDELGYPPDDHVEIVANRFVRKSAEIPLEDAERSLKTKILWTVPNDLQAATDSINLGKTLCEIAPSSEINRQISGLAGYLQNGLVQGGDRKNGLFGRVFFKMKRTASTRCTPNKD